MVVCLAILLAFAFQGAWLVLPFAAAELFVLLLAFRFIEQHAGDFESIAIKGDRVLVERWETGRVRRYEFNRYWAQVVVSYPVPAGNRFWRCAPTGARWSLDSI